MHSTRRNPEIEYASDGVTNSEARPASDHVSGTAEGGLSHRAPSPIGRWGARRKADVVDAVRRGHLGLNEACTRYALSLEEFLSWQERLQRSGLAGLKMRSVQTARRVNLGTDNETIEGSACRNTIEIAQEETLDLFGPIDAARQAKRI
jgi:hypothetical protein